MDCSLLVWGELLPRMKNFKYLVISLVIEGKMDGNVDRWVGVASAVMRALNWTVVVKKDLRHKAKILIYKSIN